jgi:hypothetical protein
MRDPHVEEVHYEVGTGDGLSYSNPPAMSITNHLGRFELADGKLTIYPADHFADGTQARAVLDPFVRAWEIESDLSRNIGSIRFKYTGVRKVDRSPAPAPGSGARNLSALAGEIALVGKDVSFHVTQSTYPPPPADFRTTPEVETAYRRWRAFRERREPLPSMAYAVLTLLESLAGGRHEAAATFHIDRIVLDTIGRLSSTKGDSDSARKFTQGGQVQPLTGMESAWLEAAIRRVVRRMGEHAAGVQLTQLAMSELPQI